MMSSQKEHKSDTMKTALVEHPSDPGEHPYKIENVDIPHPNEDEVLVQVKASGCCHTDLHATSDEWPILHATFPLVPGHEGIGTVAKKGSNVTHLEVGDRVGMFFLNAACGACEYCVSGWETLCPEQKNSGYTVPGFLREYAIASAAYTVRIPDELSSEEAAPIMCAGVTAYKALKVCDARPGQFVAVVGAAGGIGHLACQYARAMGYRVIAIDIGAEKKAFCESLGVECVVDLNDVSGDAGDLVRQCTKGGAHAVIASAPIPTAYKSAIRLLRPRGTMVVLGQPAGDFEVPQLVLVNRALTIRGSIIGTRQDLREALDFAARGLVKCKITTAHLEDLNEICAKLKDCAVEGRVVVQM